MAASVFQANPGRGVDIYFFGTPPEWRLPMRAYHGGMFFKNGMPAGYVEMLSFFERAEVGFNLYYTFLLHVPRRRVCVAVRAIAAVVPTDLGGKRFLGRPLPDRPRKPGGDRFRRVLVLPPNWGFGLPEAGTSDRFRIRNVGLAVQRAIAERFQGDPEKFRHASCARVSRALGREARSELALALSLIPDLERWTADEKRAAAEILQAKETGSEARYLRLMHGHGRRRAAILELGRATPVAGSSSEKTAAASYRK